ncbi:MAG: MarR family transcriptional regulator [Actinobacteria bacterium]|nr:MarR family transcriptional regulator [Actinomycetota bacterium]
MTSQPAYPPPAPGEPVSPGPVAPGSGTPEPPSKTAAHPKFSPDDLQSAVERSKQAGWAWGDEDAKIPDDAALPELLPMAARTMGTFWGQTVQGTGITGAGLAVLRVLAARNGLKSSEVAARGWSTPGTVTTVVDTLVRDGLVRRERDVQDRRVVRLYVTERGMDKLIETLTEVGPRWRECFDYVDPADEPVIRKFLIDTIERFSTLIRKERGT